MRIFFDATNCKTFSTFSLISCWLLGLASMPLSFSPAEGREKSFIRRELTLGSVRGIAGTALILCLELHGASCAAQQEPSTRLWGCTGMMSRFWGLEEDSGRICDPPGGPRLELPLPKGLSSMGRAQLVEN